MFDKAKTMRSARKRPNELQFVELCLLVEAHGFALAGGSDGHVVYRHPIGRAVLTLQDDAGRARPYQVAQVIAAIDDLPAASKRK